MPQENLRQRAHAECLRRLTRLLDAELEVQSGPATVEWDATFRRQVFEQPFTVWREFDEVEVQVSPTGRILSFRDRNRLMRVDGSEPPALTGREILQIAGTTGLVGESASVERTFIDPNHMLVAMVVQDEGPDFPARTRYSLNPRLRQVAAFEIVEEPGL